LEELLEIKRGETTKDNKFTLECVNCIGACAKAPAMMINETVYGELTKEKAKKIIEGLP
jgi:NADH:ubiquinone oxidoreductase subunit E